MSQFLHAQYLRGFGGDGRKRCSCGQVHEIATKEILLGDGVMGAIPRRILQEHGEGTVVWVLSDEHTDAAAGMELKHALRGLSLAEEVLPGSPKPECTPRLVDRLANRARGASAGLILSVGGGTLCDLGKSVSWKLGVPNWGLMTAASMDAHTSGTANWKTDKGAITHPAVPSSRVFCDLTVLRRAPKELFLAGLGDQLAKLLGYLDWQLGAWLFGEHFCPETAETSLQSGRQVLQALRAAEGPEGEEHLRLADALLASGLCMQTLRHSRPAASAEHTAAHLWEIAHVARNPRLALHGLLVGAASGLVARAYREFFRLLPGLPLDIPARVEELGREPSWELTLDEEIRPYRAILEQAAEGRVPVAQTSRESLERFTARRPQIQELADKLLDELEEGVGLLRARGFPFDLSEHGLTRPEILLPFRYIRRLRNRTGAFDLMHLLGVERRIYDTVLAAGW